MGWIEEVHPAKLMYDDRYAEWRESQRSTARYLPQVAREGEEDEPDVLVQVARIKERRRQRRAAMLPPTGSSAWAMPLADDKVTFLNKPTLSQYENAAAEAYGNEARVIDLPGFVNDNGDFISPDRYNFETEFGVWLSGLLADGIITQERFNELGLRKYEHRTPTRRELAVERLKALREEGVLDNEQFDQLLEDVDTPGFKLHKNPLYYTRILKYCRMLELIRDFMDDWIAKGMPAGKGSDLEKHLIKVGKWDAIAAYEDWPPPKGMTKEQWAEYRQLVESPSFGLGRKVTEKELRELYRIHGKYDRLVKKDKASKGSIKPSPVEPEDDVHLERGRRIISGAWAVFREDVNRAIEIARQPELVGFVNIGYLAVGVNMPGVPGYTLDPRFVAEAPPNVVMDIMIHEPMHDLSRYRVGHTAMGGWKRVDEEIGWNAEGGWGSGVGKMMFYVLDVMRLTPGQAGPEVQGAKNLWESALRRSGIRPQ